MPSDPNLAARRKMVAEQIRRRGVRDERVLEIMESVPRELFVAESCAGAAFADKALPIAFDQTISQPYVVASMTEHLNVQEHHRVLEVGTGSGYQTAILSRLAHHVFTIERIAALQDAARERLLRLGITNVTWRTGDGSAGWLEEAPFDRIIVTAGAPHVPPSLLAQLVEGGRLVIPVGRSEDQTLTVIDRVQGRMHESPQYPCRFVRLIGREGWTENGARS